MAWRHVVRRSLLLRPRDFTSAAADGAARAPGSCVWPGLFTAGSAAACFGAAAVAPALPSLCRDCPPLDTLRNKISIIIDYIQELGVGLGVGPPSPRLSSAAAAVVAANVAVFCAWKAAPRARLLSRYFLQRPSESRALPLLLSTFSHKTPVHLGFNMMAFWSFSAPAAAAIGGANTLALYLSAGVASSFFSTIVRHTLPALRQSTMVPSLGASGAVWSLIAFVGCQYPEAKMSVLFLPMCAFPAYQMVLGLAAVDVVGVALGWRFLDHAAHLGGLACGAGFYAIVKDTKWLQSFQRRTRISFRRARRYYLDKLKKT
jgi:rhomboid-like protein